MFALVGYDATKDKCGLPCMASRSLLWAAKAGWCKQAVVVLDPSLCRSIEGVTTHMKLPLQRTSRGVGSSLLRGRKFGIWS